MKTLISPFNYRKLANYSKECFSMATKIICVIAISCILFTSMQLCNAQIILKPDPSVEFSKSRGIIALIPTIKGSFYMNNYFLTEIKGRDTIYIINFRPGSYYIKFITQSDSLQRMIDIYKNKVVEIKPGSDSISIGTDVLKWYTTTEKIVGKPFYFVLKNHVYSIIQFSAFNIMWLTDENEIRVFSTISAMTGYQVSPGFCIGAGLAYNRYDIPASYYNPCSIDNVSTMPVYGDLRVHLSDRRVSPFFNLDLGYNFLLTKKMAEVYYQSTGYFSHSTAQVIKGGIHLSLGIGIRIAINRSVQIIPSVEYCYEKGKTLSTYVTNYQNYYETYGTFKNNIFRINIGIGFQYR
jgi:hypothetical protein